MTDPTTNDSVQVEQLDLRDDGTNLTLEVQLHNGLDRPAHVYAGARNIQYDPGSRELVVRLADENTADLDGTGHFMLPPFDVIDPQATGTVTVRLPRALTRIAPGSGPVSVELERLEIHEASTLIVRVAWSDTPFYVDPRREGLTARTQLIGWQRGVAEGRTALGTAEGDTGG